MTISKAGELVSQSMKTIYLWSLSKVSDPYEAEELSSDVIAAVLANAEKLRCDDAFFGFLWQVARNTYKNYLRRRNRVKTAPIDENLSDESDVLGDICRSEELSTLRRELAFLSEKYRICTVSYYFDGLSVREIAEKNGLTPDTVKVNLFKSRKILKEGIAMDRQFGKKSFKPAPFKINYIINGEDNIAYYALTNSLMATQILHSAYYEPMTAEQLSTELGIARVYIEYEIDLLMHFELLKKIGDKKYQTNLLVLSGDFLDAASNKMSKLFTERIGKVVEGVKSTLSKIRGLGFENSETLSDNVLLWDLFAYLCIKSLQKTDGGAKPKELYSDPVNGVTTGIAYAVDRTDGAPKKYSYRSIAGYCEVNGIKNTHIDFSCNYPKTNVDISVISVADYPRFKNDELDRFMEIVSPEFEELQQIFRDVAKVQVETLYDFTPDCAKELIEYYCPHLTLWNMVGWFGWAALESGALESPADGERVGIVGYID